MTFFIKRIYFPPLQAVFFLLKTTKQSQGAAKYCRTLHTLYIFLKITQAHKYKRKYNKSFILNRCKMI